MNENEKHPRILVIADLPSRYLYDFYEPGKLSEYDLIISCGDLPAEYLTFLATFFNGPVLYVHGNHDAKYTYKPPEGCIDIEDRVYNFHGIRILGLGGSMRYNVGPFQYTQDQMYKRIRKLRWTGKLRKGIDIIVTHAPPYHVNDMEDLPHQGFMAFLDLIELYHPKYLIHGHVHLSYGKSKRITEFENTIIINAYEKYAFTYQ